MNITTIITQMMILLLIMIVGFVGAKKNIFNDEVKSVPVPDKLDRQWYINLANKRLSDFGVVI